MALAPDEHSVFMHALRTLRDNILAFTDQLLIQTDRFTPQQLEAIKAYRQELRDCTSKDTSFIQNLDFPVGGMLPPLPEFLHPLARKVLYLDFGLPDLPQPSTATPEAGFEQPTT